MILRSSQKEINFYVITQCSRSIYINYSSKEKHLETFVMNIPWLQWDQNFFSAQLFFFFPFGNAEEWIIHQYCLHSSRTIVRTYKICLKCEGLTQCTFMSITAHFFYRSHGLWIRFHHKGNDKMLENSTPVLLN